MEANFATVQPWILAHEGGYVNHPRDPGGATNQGITQGTYNAWRRANNLATQSVRKLTAKERDTIYREEYWNVIRGDDLPAGVDYAVYDFAVNSGPARAAKYLQRVVGAKQDGIIGSQTLAATADHDPEMVVRRLCNDRMAFLKRLSHWPTFGRGWTRRVMGQFDGAQDDDVGVVDRAIKLARSEVSEAPTASAPGKATGDAEKPQEAPEPVPAPAPASEPEKPAPAEPAPPSEPAETKEPEPRFELAQINKALVAFVVAGGGLAAAMGVDVTAMPDEETLTAVIGGLLNAIAVFWIPNKEQAK